MHEIIPENFKYIVFAIDNTLKAHNGKVFTTFFDAQKFIYETIKEEPHIKFCIGCFLFDAGYQLTTITNIETFGFKNDRDPLKVDLFKQKKLSEISNK